MRPVIRSASNEPVGCHQESGHSNPFPVELASQTKRSADGALSFLQGLLASLRSIALLTGCARSADIAAAPRHLGADLEAWLRDLGIR